MRAVLRCFTPLLALALSTCGHEPTRAVPPPATLPVRAEDRPLGGFLIAAAAPDTARLREVLRAGLRVLALRPAADDPLEAQALAAALGGRFARVALPAAALEDGAARGRVYTIFDEAAREPQAAYVYAGSLDELGAIWALYRAEHEHLPLEEALAEGRSAGLASLEPTVREILRASR